MSFSRKADGDSAIHKSPNTNVHDAERRHALCHATRNTNNELLAMANEIPVDT